MKKIVLFFVALIISSVESFGQFKVSSNGNVSIGTSSTPISKFTVNHPGIDYFENYFYGPNVCVGITCTGRTSSSPYWGTGLRVFSGVVSNNGDVGIESSVNSTTALSSGHAIGVIGEAGNAAQGYNVGIAGGLLGSNNGTGVLGSSDLNVKTICIPGKYAGYFEGNVTTNGTSTSLSFISPSDMRLSENVISLNNRTNQGETLEKVLGMNVLQYNYKLRKPQLTEDASPISEATQKRLQKEAEQKHYGLSAQELQQIYPELVVEGQDGYLGINYVELVPILIQSIQELKQELDEVKGTGNKAVRKAACATSINGVTSSGNVLFQNTPNPFKENTTIRFHLADDAQNAAICIFDMTGKMLKKLSVSQGMESVSIAGYELGEGMFLYTLMVNGQEIDTKRMIITK